MLSGIIGGVLRAGLVAATTGGLVTGVVLMARNAQNNDEQVQIEATRSLATAATTADGIPNTPPLTPDATPEAVDMGDWETHSSTYGYSIAYPPEWVLNEYPVAGEFPPTDDPGETIALMNPLFVQARDDAGIPGGGEFAPLPGSVKIDVAVLPAQGAVGSTFDEAPLVGLCQNVGDPIEALEGPQDVAEIATIDGSPAVICRGIDLGPTGDEIPALVVWVRLPGGRTLQMAAGMTEPSQLDIDLAMTIMMVEVSEDA